MKTTQTVARLERRNQDGLAVVLFTVKGEDEVSVFTFGTWTCHSHRSIETRDEARATWRRLRSEGWTKGETKEIDPNDRSTWG